MNLEEFQSLLARSESETLDFKQDGYDLSNPERRGEFIKDVLSMANTPREFDAHIVLGVRWSPEAGIVLSGLVGQCDDAVYQDAVSHKHVSPRPQFRYTPLSLDGRQVGVVTIPCQSGGPFTPTNDGLGLQGGAVYFRRGSTKARAVGEELRRIAVWFTGGGIDLPDHSPPMWPGFFRSIGGFAPTMRYVLIADRIPSAAVGQLEALGFVPWRAVVDLDRASEATGLLSRIAVSIQARRAVHRAMPSDLRVQPEPGIHWYFASGIDGDNSAPVDHKGWIKVRKRALSDQLAALKSALSPAPVAIIAIWAESPPALLRTVLEEV